MIGGIDIPIPTRAGDLAIEVAVRAIRQAWPNAVFADATTGVGYDHFREIPFGNITELFVYQDSTFAKIWDDEGAIPDVSNTMIHLIADQGSITVVVDERNAEMEAIITAIRYGLTEDIGRMNRFSSGIHNHAGRDRGRYHRFGL
jgi:hypothetical protein